MIPQVGGRAFGQQQTYTRSSSQPQSPMAVSSDDGHVRRPRSLTQSFSSIGAPQYQGSGFNPIQNPLGGFRDIGAPQQQQQDFSRIGAPNYQGSMESVSPTPYTPQQPQNPMPGMPQQQQAPSAGGSFPPMPAHLSPYAQAQYENARQEAARRDRGQSRPASQNPMPGMPQPQQAPSAGGTAPTYPPSQSDSAAADFRRNGMSASPPSDPSGQAAADFRRNGMRASPPGPGAASQNPARLDLSSMNTQGASTGSTIPGMFMQGAAGMAAGGMLTGSRMGSAFAEMDSAQQAQRDPNFVGPRTQNPMQDGPWDQRRNDQFRRGAVLDANPLPGSSNQAALLAGQLQSPGVLNPMSAEAANQYNGFVADANDPNRMTPDQKYAAAQQSAQRMGQSDPTNMSGRFGADSALGQQAAKNAQNEASVAAGTQYEIPQGYGTLPEYRPINPSPEVKYRANPDGSQGSSYLPNTDPVLGRQQAAARRQWGDLGSPAGVAKAESRRTQKAAETTRREGVKFRHMISQGMNPMSPQAQGMFPKQVAAMKKDAGQNPMQMGMGTPGTVEAQIAGTKKVASDMASNSQIIAMGGKPGATLSDINRGVSSHLAGNGNFSDDSLKAFQAHAIAQVATMTGESDPFDFGSTTAMEVESDLWRALALAPDTPYAREQWLQRYRAREKEVEARRRELGGPPTSGNNNPGYAAPGASVEYPAPGVPRDTDPSSSQFRFDRPTGF